MKLAGVLGLGLARAGSVFEAIVASGSTLLDDLVSYWTLDEQSGTRADAVGDNDLTDNNTVLAVNRGPVGTVAKFVAASSEYLSKDDMTHAWLGGDFTVQAWVKQINASANSANTIVSVYPGFPAIRFIFQANTQEDGNSRILAYIGNGVDASSAVDRYHVAEDTNWHQYLITRELATDTVTIYRDNTTNWATSNPTSDVLNHDIPTTAAKFAIGAGNNYSEFSNAHIDGVAIWSGILDAATRTSLFNSGNGKRYADLTTAEKVGLVSYWDLSEVSGTRVDAHGDNDLTDNNTVGSVNTGPLGTVATFVGASSESLTLASAFPATNGDFTYSTWVKRRAGQTGVAWAAAPDTYLYLADGQTRFNIDSSGGAQTIDHQFFGEAWDELWLHIVLQASGNKQYMWVNGVAASTGQGQAIPATRVASDQFGIGDRPSSSVPWDGEIGPSGFWSTAISEAERTSLFNSGNGKRYADLTAAEKVGLVSYWNLDEASGTRVDAHGDNDLTDNNTVLSTINAPPALDGAAASFVAANSESLSATTITGPGDWTVSAWGKVADNSTDTLVFYSLHGTWASQIHGVVMLRDGLPQGLCSDGTNYVSFQINKRPDNNAWFNVMAWYSSSDKKMHLTLNNADEATSDALSGAALWLGPGTLKIGTDIDASAEATNGLIDEVSIWSRVLTSDERAELFALGAGKFYPFS